jgi:hypothetical protein
LSAKNPIWFLVGPRDNEFARFTLRGTWQGSEKQGVCEACGASDEERVSPLIIEWQSGSDQVGDFIWPDMPLDAALSANAVRKLQGKVGGFALGPVEMLQNRRLKRPTKPNRRTRPRIWLPYDGPPIYDLLVTKTVPADMDRSSLRFISKCSICGNESYELDGVECAEVIWSPQDGAGVIMRHPRKKNCGLYVARKYLPRPTIFRVREWDGWILCTDSARVIIEDAALTNVKFEEVGEVF